MSSSDHRNLLFVGTHGHVRAIDKRTGADIWTTSLPDTGYTIVSLLYEAGLVFAGSKGYVFALDATSGRICWSNQLSGLGYEHMILATASQSNTASMPVAGQTMQDAASDNTTSQ
ncbi:MAG: hypothetical protein EHM48_04450 [Planctomycetaceae bacterium]|nr:MAG: hypothetical protein EHM48_04450 [Planctomycetaceae bacterium]